MTADDDAPPAPPDAPPAPSGDAPPASPEDGTAKMTNRKNASTDDPAQNKASTDSAKQESTDSAQKASTDSAQEAPPPSEELTPEQVNNIEKARMRVKKAFARSNLLDVEKDHLFPRFDWDEIKTGDVLGVGGFGTVKEITKIKVKKEKRPNASFSFRDWVTATGSTKEPEKKEEDFLTEEEELYYEQQFQDKRFIEENCTRKTGEARYAVKYISPKVKNNHKMFLRAAMDMATETQFLSVIRHDHVIKMRAVGLGDMFEKDYFLVLDRLYDTLVDRIEKWNLLEQKHHTCIARFRGGRKKSRHLLGERLTVANQLVSAVDYLHSLNIIYRDVKPENIGFDIRDTVKLFDYGLAKELHPEDKRKNDTYKLTGMAGSIRYMAPEVFKKFPYNYSADVYSFGVLLWEIISMEEPFHGYRFQEIKDRVFEWGERPPIDKSWPVELQKVIKSCWDASFRKRPSFKEVSAVLDKEIATLSQD